MFTRVTLLPLTEEQQLCIVKRQLSKSSSVAAPNIEGGIENVLQGFSRRQTLRHDATGQKRFVDAVTSSPVLLSLLVVVINNNEADEGAAIPTTLLQLYKRAIEHTLDAHLKGRVNRTQAFDMLVCLAVQLLTRVDAPEGEQQQQQRQRQQQRIAGLSRVFGNVDVCQAFACRTTIPHVVPSVQQMQRTEWVELWSNVRGVPLFRQLAESTQESATILEQWESGAGVDENDDIELQFKHLSIQEALVALVLSRGGLPDFWGCTANERHEVARQGDGCSMLQRGWFQLTKGRNWKFGLQPTLQVMKTVARQLDSGVWQNVLRIGGPELGALLAPVLERMCNIFILSPTALASLAECHGCAKLYKPQLRFVSRKLGQLRCRVECGGWVADVSKLYGWLQCRF